MCFKCLLCFAYSNNAISVLTISQKSLYTMSTGQRELKLCEEYDCQDVTHALISKYDALLKSCGRGGGGGGGRV